MNRKILTQDQRKQHNDCQLVGFCLETQNSLEAGLRKKKLLHLYEELKQDPGAECLKDVRAPTTWGLDKWVKTKRKFFLSNFVSDTVDQSRNFC